MNTNINHRDYRYRIIRVKGYGPWRSIREIANFTNRFNAEHTFWMMIYSASKEGHRVRLELYDREEKRTIFREASGLTWTA